MEGVNIKLININDFKIGITGPHGAGKTTLLNKLSDILREENIEILPEVTRTLKKQGFLINEQGTTDTQLMIMSMHINNLLLHKRFIVDRILLDGFIYTEYLYKKSQVPKWVVDYSYNLCYNYINRYNYIFYIPAEFDLVSDGVRSNNIQFYEDIVKSFDHYIFLFKKKYNNIYIITGTVEQRANKVISILSKDSNFENREVVI